MKAEHFIKTLELTPHPEGGHFREYFRSNETLSLETFPGEKFSAATAAYFLLAEGEVSLLHRIPFDEIWQFITGDPVILVTIDSEGKLKKTKLGNNVASGEVLHARVPANTWMGAYPVGEFSLLSCYVAPGFEFSKLEFAEKSSLLKEYPSHEKEISRLCP